MFPKYVSLYHRRHCRIGLSEGGNDFFFFCSYFCVERDQSSAGYQAIYYPASSPLSCLGKCNLSWFTQLPQDRERKRNISHSSIVGQKEFREIHRKATRVQSVSEHELFVWRIRVLFVSYNGNKCQKHSSPLCWVWNLLLSLHYIHNPTALNSFTRAHWSYIVFQIYLWNEASR